MGFACRLEDYPVFLTSPLNHSTLKLHSTLELIITRKAAMEKRWAIIKDDVEKTSLLQQGLNINPHSLQNTFTTRH